MKKQKILEKLEEHFSRKFEFTVLKTKPEIKFKFKKNKTNINGRINLDHKIVKINIYNDTHFYGYLSNKIAQEFLCSWFVFYPEPIGKEDENLVKWIKKWKHDRRRRNKPARQLYGYSK